jgi:hypothetical protein
MTDLRTNVVKVEVSLRDDPHSEMVLVPRKPTKDMLYEAKYDAMGEDAAAVWETMIKTWLNAKSGTH